MKSKTRERRAGILEPGGSALRTRITSTGIGSKEADVPKYLRAFRATVWRYYRNNGRHDLPWRKTKDPYKILVSEIMLQQTQVSRVIEKYKSFLKKFPTMRALAKAPLSEVLKEWSGLGYNRRGKYLYDAAKEIVETYRGDIQAALAHPLPGVGPYTKSAVRVFAFNQPDMLIETNIRAAFIHHFFSKKYGDPTSGERKSDLRKVGDQEILQIATEAAMGQDPRNWHWALMDYGAHLKRSGVRNNYRSAHYAKQSKFKGSLRQVRGAILREMHIAAKTEQDLNVGPTRSHMDPEKVRRALEGLARDGLIKKEKGKWRIA